MPRDFTLAKRYLSQYETGLRAGDALRLAIANNHRAEAIYSREKSLVKAGRDSRPAGEHGNSHEMIALAGCHSAGETG